MESIIQAVNNDGPSNLESHLGYWLRLVSNQVSSEFARALSLRNISVAEWTAMRRLYDGEGLKPSDLASSMGMTQGAISKVIDKLEAKRWVDSFDDHFDGRSRVLLVSDAGREAVPTLSKIADQNDVHFFGPLSGRERKAIRKILIHIAEIHGWHEIPTT